MADVIMNMTFKEVKGRTHPNKPLGYDIEFNVTDGHDRPLTPTGRHAPWRQGDEVHWTLEDLPDTTDDTHTPRIYFIEVFRWKDGAPANVKFEPGGNGRADVDNPLWPFTTAGTNDNVNGPALLFSWEGTQWVTPPMTVKQYRQSIGERDNKPIWCPVRYRYKIRAVTATPADRWLRAFYGPFFDYTEDPEGYVDEC